MACVGAAAFFATSLSATPSLYSILIFERAVPAQSISSLVVLGIALLLLIVCQVGINWAGQEYAVCSWRMLARSSRGNTQLLQRIDRAHTSGLVWATFCLIPSPLLMILAVILHPAVGGIILATLVFYYGASKLHLHLFPKIITAILSPVALTAAAGLAIVGSISPGAIVSASYLVVAICAPAREVIRNQGDLVATLDAYKLLRKSGGFINVHIDPVLQATAMGYARSIVLINGFVLFVIVLACFVPAPSVTVLQGRVAPLAAAADIKAQITAKVESLGARDGDRVKIGTPLISFDGREFQYQASNIDQQITLEKQGVEAAELDRQTRMELLRAQALHMEGMVGKKLRPDADLTALRLAHATEKQRLDEAVYQRKSSLLRLMERRTELMRLISTLVVMAPSDGRIQQLAIRAGQTVNQGDHLLTLVSDSEPTVEALLTPLDRPRILEGQRAEVRLQTSATRYGDTLTGTVRSISADRYPDGLYRVFIDVPTSLPTGTATEVSIIHSERQTVVQWGEDVVGGALRRTIR